MKKTIRILLTLLCFTTIILSGCGKVNYYSITANWSSSYGSVSGFKTEKVAENTIVTLKAGEHYKDTHPLLAWVKNNEYLVKVANHTADVRDNTLELVASAETEGNYTAVFAEEETSMMYALINSTSLSINNAQKAKDFYSYKISYAIMSAGSDSYLPFEDRFGEDFKTNILYFGKPGHDYQFKFKVEVTFEQKVGNATEKIVQTITNDTIISKANFESELDFEFDVNNSQSGKFTISFAKFTEAVMQQLIVSNEPQA